MNRISIILNITLSIMNLNNLILVILFKKQSFNEIQMLYYLHVQVILIMENNTLVPNRKAKGKLNLNPQRIFRGINKHKDKVFNWIKTLTFLMFQMVILNNIKDVENQCFEMYDECNYEGRCVRLCGRFPEIPDQIKNLIVKSIRVIYFINY